MSQVNSLCEYSIAFLKRIDDLGTLSDEESAQISRIDSRDNLVLKLRDYLNTRLHSGDGLAEGFVLFVQAVARTNWDGRPPLSQQMQEEHKETLKRLLPSGACQYGGREASGHRFFIAILAWDAILANLSYTPPVTL